MLEKNQIKFLRTLAQSYKPVVQVGKGGITTGVLEQVEMALEAHELVKVTLLETSPIERNEAADAIAEATGSEKVQVIGRTFVLYRKSDKERILLPKN
ncbi:ribosome assembly RNA-binding protein YhbY [Alicyclobacillus tolerans]|uniref:RNA-binding protein n=2 Tax=Alicyclobacillus tolerans TaxID=90970 RepID=A0ABT9LSV6_9BACL|nr:MULTISPECIES: ribosome assembly RNA-binding protein YhbY [Alicyclobacillus]MDP9727351.1 RNA-binding protein [Alicyclobacillus tengchongensis]SHJ52135.1 RNA-binding protein [Alicyclobacillus montanus]